MGQPKAALEWHGSTLLRRTAGILARVADGPVLVVRAPGQELPALPPRVTVTAVARPRCSARPAASVPSQVVLVVPFASTTVATRPAVS